MFLPWTCSNIWALIIPCKQQIYLFIYLFICLFTDNDFNDTRSSYYVQFNKMVNF